MPDIVVVKDTEIQIVTVGEQGPAGPPGTSERFTAENKQGATIARGQVVATHGSGTGFVLASAANNSKNGLGLAIQGIAPAVSGDALLGGVIEVSDWTDVIGAPTLAPLAGYFLSTVAGKLTAVAPSIPGQIVQFIGAAISTTALRIEIAEPILL